MQKIAGGCLCGKVRYESTAEPEMTVVCHCRHCQKTSGSAFSINIGLPAGSVEMTGGNLARFEDTGTSGKPVRRLFCRDCGCSLGTEADVFPGVLFLKAGTLDDISWLDPTTHIWTKSKQPWVSISPDAVCIETNPG